MPELVDVRDVALADIYKAGVRAATLIRDGDDIVFRYLPEYLAAGDLPALAYRLPKTEQPLVTHASHLHSFFAGLLPEGLRLQATIDATRSSADDHLSLLLAVGADAIGDVQVVADGEPADAVTAAVDMAEPAQLDFAALFSQAVSGDPQLLDRRALPGVQHKLSASMLSTPLHTSAGAAILKLNPPTHPRLVENEHFFLALAAACGLATPEHQLLYDQRGAAGLLVTRFDRDASIRGARVQRLAQEDACQVLDRYPGSKYRLSLQAVITGLAGAVAALGGSRAATTLQALEISAFSYLIGNGDLHAKNLSILKPAGRPWMLAPAYDLLCTRAYQGDDDMALEFFGRRSAMPRAHWLSAARQLGIPEAAMDRSLQRLVSRAAPWIERVAEIGFDVKITARIERQLRARSRELSGQ